MDGFTLSPLSSSPFLSLPSLPSGGGGEVEGRRRRRSDMPSEEKLPEASTPTSNFWGSNPSEEEYHISRGVRGRRFFFRSPTTGLPLFARSWAPLDRPPRAAICMIHGYGNDTSWTFQSTAIAFSSSSSIGGSGFLCLALDLPGHGLSSGLSAFVPDLRPVLRDLIAFFSSAAPDIPRFLYGESMGAAICLLLHLERPEMWEGAVLVAPMCKIADSLRPPWPVPHILIALARIAPTLACVPTADLLEKSIKVPEKKVVAAANPRRYTGRPRLGTVVELLRVTDELHARLSEVTSPFLVVHGSADVVTDPEVSRELYEKARSKDKTIKIYEGMMHSLLFGEPDENIEMVRSDILDWLMQRSGVCRR